MRRTSMCWVSSMRGATGLAVFTLGLGAGWAAPPRPSAYQPVRVVGLAQKPVSQMSTKEVRAVVEALLSGYEPGDPQEPLRRLGPAATEALLSLANDPTTSPLRRLRAIEALGHV